MNFVDHRRLLGATWSAAPSCEGPQDRCPGAAVGARRGAAGGRRRVPVRPRRDRGDRAVRIVLFTFQHLLGQLLLSEERAEELERRTQAARQPRARDSPGRHAVALLHTLDLRDRMTARHSAAVARYAQRDRDRGRLLQGGAGARPHRRPAARHRQVHLPRPDPQGRHEAHRGGLEDHQDAPLPGREDRRPRSRATGRSARSSSRTTSGSTARATHGA